MKIKIVFRSLRNISFLLFLFCGIAVHAQTYLIWENGGYGLIDGSGKTVFPAIATDTSELSRSIIIFKDRDKQKYGLATKEKIILPADYDFIKREETGFILELNEKKGFADITGKKILKPDYRSVEISAFHTLLVYPDSLGGIVDLTGKNITGFDFSEINDKSQINCYVVNQNKKWGLIDSVGKLKIPFVYDDLYPSYVFPYYIVEKDKKQGVIDISGKIILPLEYDLVRIETNTMTDHNFITMEKQEKQGYANLLQTVFLKPQFTSTEYIQYDGVIAVLNGKTILLDSLGKIILAGFEEIKTTKNPVFVSTKLNKRWGLYTIQGKQVIPNTYTDAFESEDGVFETTLNNKTIYFDKKGKQLHSYQFNEDSLSKKYDDYSFLGRQLIAVKKSGKWGAVNYHNAKNAIPVIYDSLYTRPSVTFFLPDQNGASYGDPVYRERILRTETVSSSIPDAVYAIQNSKTSVIDTTGKVLIPAEYEDIGIFFHNRALVKKNGKYGYITTLNEVIIPIEYDSIQEPFTYKEEKLILSNSIIASKKKKLGVIDSMGKVIIDFQFDSLSDFGENNYAFVTVGTKTGVIDRKGNYLIKLQDYKLDGYNGLGTVSCNGNPVICINSNGEEVWRNKDKAYMQWISFNGNMIPENIKYLKDLESFEMQFSDPDVLGVSGPVSIPAELYHMKQLKRLDLNYKIDRLSPEIKNLENLRMLNISFYNSFEPLPKEIGELPSLDTLIIRDYYSGNYDVNSIKEPVLPAEIENLSSLKYLETYLTFTKLPKQLLSFKCGQPVDSNAVFDRLAVCSQLEALQITYSSDWQLQSFLDHFSSWKKLKRANLTDYSGYYKVFSMMASAASIDTLKITGFYSDNTSIPKELSERPITYLTTNLDSLYFPQLLHLKYTETSLYHLPRGLENCKHLKTLEIQVKSNADWTEILNGFMPLSSLESLTLTIEPDYYSQQNFSFDRSFYDGISKLVADGKLNTLVIHSDMLTEDTIAELKTQFSGLSLSILR